MARADIRVAGDHWGRVFALSAVLTLLAVSGWEAYWRSRGARPSISDTEASWSLARSRVASESTVLLGTSKMQSAIDPQVFAAASGGRAPIQLALIASSPLPVLEHLARDRSFRGRVILDIVSGNFFNLNRHEDPARAILDAHESILSSPSERAGRHLRLWLEGRFVFRHSAFSIERILRSAFTGLPMRVPDWRTRPDRLVQIDLRKRGEKGLEAYADKAVRRTQRALERGLPPGQVERISDRLRHAVDSIRRRGGSVVAVSLPTSGRFKLEIEREYFPRQVYWDGLLASADLEGIHSDDYPELAVFESPDGLHLDQRDAAAFTRAFVEVLAR